VLFVCFADKKTVNLATRNGDRNYDRIGTHGQSANGLGPPSALLNLVEEDSPGELRPARIQSCGAAIHVVIAGSTGRKFELSQTKRLGCQQMQKFLTGRRHGKSKIA
jgi:hypothetical protein